MIDERESHGIGWLQRDDDAHRADTLRLGHQNMYAHLLLVHLQTLQYGLNRIMGLALAFLPAPGRGRYHPRHVSGEAYPHHTPFPSGEVQE